MHNLSSALLEIDNLACQTTAYKAGILLGLKSNILKILNNCQLDTSKLDELTSLCNELLMDKLFTAKTFSLFGTMKSRTEKFIRQLIHLLINQKIYILIDIVEWKLPSKTALRDNMNNKDYLSAKSTLCAINHSSSSELQAIHTYLDNKLSLRVNLSASSNKYNRLFWPSLEVNQSQQVYDLNEVLKIVRESTKNKTISFTFAIDKYRNLLFSRDAHYSHHVNLCQGDQVSGAGEIYFTSTDNGVILNEINNRSGLYRPETEFLLPLKSHLNKFGINTNTTKLSDESLKIKESDQNIRTFL